MKINIYSSSKGIGSPVVSPNKTEGKTKREITQIGWMTNCITLVAIHEVTHATASEHYLRGPVEFVPISIQVVHQSY